MPPTLTPAADPTPATTAPSVQPSRLARVTAVVARRRRAVLLLAVLGAAAAVPIAGLVRDGLVLSRFQSPGSESVEVRERLAADFDTGSWDALLLVTATEGTVHDQPVVEAGRSIATRLASEPGVAEVASPWDRGTSTLVSEDGRHALVLMRLPGDPTTVRQEVLPHIEQTYERDDPLVTVRLGGGEQVFRQVGAQAEADFVRAELILLPVAFLLLVLLLRGVVAALLPMGVALLTVLGALSLLAVLLPFVEISTFALNLILVMGFALGMDFSLFVITRFREELHRGREVVDAVVTAVATAGRAAAFSGITTCVSLSVLLIFPFPFLRSFAYAGVATAAAALVAALVVLPAGLAAIGHRIERGAVRWGRATAAGPPPLASPSTEGFWARLSSIVMRRPALAGGGVVVLLLLAGAPVLGTQFGAADHRVLLPEASSHQVQEVIRAGFPAEEDDGINVLVSGPTVSDQALAAHAAGLSQLPAVAEVAGPTGTYVDGDQVEAAGPRHERYRSEQGGAWMLAVPVMDLLDADRHGTVAAVREHEAPFDVLVGGYPVELTDFQQALTSRIPLALSLILVVTIVVLFLMTGSLILPIKATVLNLLSLSVMFGLLVWGFQDGGLAGLLGFTPMDALEVSIPLLMFCVAYGLSMDYEVLVLSRISEEYARTGDTDQAVAAGLQRSGPLITAAALILALCFSAYVTSGVTLLQMLGLGVAVAVLVDASLIRGVLLPASMRLLGTWNWWAPEPLRRWHARR